MFKTRQVLCDFSKKDIFRIMYFFESILQVSDMSRVAKVVAMVITITASIAILSPVRTVSAIFPSKYNIVRIATKEGRVYLLHTRGRKYLPSLFAT